MKSLTMAAAAAVCVLAAQAASAQPYYATGYAYSHYAGAHNGYYANYYNWSNYKPYNETARVQSRLMSLGYYVGPAGSNGIKNEYTKTAIRQFQKNHGIRVDGIVGPQTRGVLNSYGRYYYPNYYQSYYNSYKPVRYNYTFKPAASTYSRVR